MEYENKNFLQEEGNTLRIHITPMHSVHGFVQLFKEYETTRKLKKLEWEKRRFFSFFVLFLHQMRERCSGKIEILMFRSDVT